MPKYFTIFVDWSRVANVINSQQQEAAWNEALRAAGPLDVKLTKEFPEDQLPGTFITCNIYPKSPLPFRKGAMGWTNQLIRHQDIYQRCECWAGWAGDPILLGSTIVHESCGHGIAPDGTPHTTGVFAQYVVRGGNFSKEDIDLRNAFLFSLARGYRIGTFVNANGQWTLDYYWEQEVNPNWVLPVWNPGYLIFALGKCPPLEIAPPGFKIVQANNSNVGDKFMVDYTQKVIYHPGPVFGNPSPHPSIFVFMAGNTPQPEFAPGPWWVIRRNSGLTGGKTVIYPNLNAEQSVVYLK